MAKEKKKQKKSKKLPPCKCPPGSPYRSVEDRDMAPPELRVRYPWDPDGPEPSRSGHRPGCPVDIEEYAIGEFYGNWPNLWARQIMIPLSGDRLKEGEARLELGKDPHDRDKLIGLYRAK